ncbi:MAG: hypothetical protein ABIR54_05140 [Burkholderiaceae bacterium]
MTSTFAPFHASSRAPVPAGADVRALAVLAMPVMQVVATSARSPAQGPPELL